MFIAIVHLVYTFLSQQPNDPRHRGCGTKALSFTHGFPSLDAGSALALWAGVMDDSVYSTKAPLSPALTSEPPPGGGPGNWLHPTLIFSGVKGKVINIFYL